MSKIGRYSADRKKIKEVGADRTITVAECGTVFSVTGACTLTLPTCAQAGKGWWIKVVNQTTGQTDVSVNSQTTIGVEVSNDCAAITGNFLLKGTAGAQAEIICDGERYIVLAHGVAAGDI